MPLGVVVGAHGLRGELRVRAGSDDIANLARVASVRLARERGGTERTEESEYGVASVRPGRRGECRLGLVGVDDRAAAQALVGRRVLARPGDLAPLGAGEFYAYELVGCRVEDRRAGPVGRVSAVWETGAADLLVVEDERGREQLVPAREPVLARVDLAARRIVIEAPPGLLEIGDG